MLSSSNKLGDLFVFALFAATGSSQPPAIAPGGIVNAASHVPDSLPAGRLAPGMQIAISGVRFADPDSETTVELQQGAWRESVKPSTLTPQLKAILPSDTPLGKIEISVTNRHGTSRPEEATVVSSSPGIGTVNGEGWGPILRDTLRPKQEVTMPVNGLHEAHPEVFVGGVPATGVVVKGSEVKFRVPAKAPAGCWTPVWIRSRSGQVSNFATISISSNGKACAQAQGWFGKVTAPGTRTAEVVVERITGVVQEDSAPKTFSFDSAAAFSFRAGSGDLSPLQLLPPPGSCTVYTGTFIFDAGALVNPTQIVGSVAKMLDIGSSITIRPESSAAPGIPPAPQRMSRDAGVKGFYSRFLGGTLPIAWGPGTPLFFKPGSLRIGNSSDGKDAGSFEMNLQIPPAFEWTNSAEIEDVVRSAGVEVQWQGMARDRQMLVMAFNVDQETEAMGSTICVAPPKAERFTIPPYALSNFPDTHSGATLPLRYLMLVSIPAGSPEQKPPAGLDDARAIYLEVQGKTVRYR